MVYFISPYITAVRAKKYKRNVLQQINHTYTTTHYLIYIPVFIAGLIPNDLNSPKHYFYYVGAMILVCLLAYLCIRLIAYYFKYSVNKTSIDLLDYVILYETKDNLPLDTVNPLIPTFEYNRTHPKNKVYFGGYTLKEFRKAMQEVYEAKSDRRYGEDTHRYLALLFHDMEDYYIHTLSDPAVEQEVIKHD